MRRTNICICQKIASTTIQTKNVTPEKIEEILRKYLPDQTGHQQIIEEAMEYSLMAGGKRLRPMLMWESYRLFGGEGAAIEPFMAAIEMIHTYSLIHDDLPALDNDDYRRGRLTSHKVYGEAMAILAGDALLNYAFETASKAMDHARDDEELLRVMKAFRILSSKPGINGMIGGQVVDVELTGKPIPEKTLRFIFELKTGALIEAAMMIGAQLAGASDEQIAAVEKAAGDIGMAFQIQDDWVARSTSCCTPLVCLPMCVRNVHMMIWITICWKRRWTSPLSLSTR